MNKKFRKTMRKAADGGNLALIALAIGVIIIIGMYIFTKAIGDKAGTAGQSVGNALNGLSVGSKPTSTSP